VILNARDAALNGAVIRPRTRCTQADSSGGTWKLTTQEAGSGRERIFEARQLVNATGPWASVFLSTALRAELVNPSATKTRNVKGSHLVVKKWFSHDRAYILQIADGRIVFVLPFEDDYLLIGTTDMDYDSDPAQVAITETERRYLLDCVHQYFDHHITDADIVASFSGVRPLYDDGASKAQETPRDNLLEYSKTRDGAGLLNIFGGKLTTYRKVAESALRRMEQPAGGMPPPWTADTPLPGGDFAPSRRQELLREYIARYPFLPEAVVSRWFRGYGRDIDKLAANVRGVGDLGRDFGAGLYEIEVAWMVDNEWARSSEDILWRRSKLGLKAAHIDTAGLEQWLAGNTASSSAPEPLQVGQ